MGDVDASYYAYGCYTCYHHANDDNHHNASNHDCGSDNGGDGYTRTPYMLQRTQQPSHGYYAYVDGVYGSGCSVAAAATTTTTTRTTTATATDGRGAATTMGARAAAPSPTTVATNEAVMDNGSGYDAYGTPYRTVYGCATLQSPPPQRTQLPSYDVHMQMTHQAYHPHDDSTRNNSNGNNNNGSGCGAAAATAAVHTPLKHVTRIYVAGRPMPVQRRHTVDVKVDLRHSEACCVIDDVAELLGEDVAEDTELLHRYVIVEGDRGEDMGYITAITRSEHIVADSEQPQQQRIGDGDDAPRVLHGSDDGAGNGGGARVAAGNDKDHDDEDGADNKDSTDVHTAPTAGECVVAGAKTQAGSGSGGGKTARPLPRVLRAATDEDLQRLAALVKDEQRALLHCQECLQRVRLHVPICIERVLFQFDKKKLIVRYTSDSYVDFNALTRALHNHYKCRIWMDQLNRDACDGMHDHRRRGDAKRRYMRGAARRRD